MIYFLKRKSDSLEATQQFLADVAPVGKVKCIRRDNGGEFVSQEFETLLREKQIKHETCAPYSNHQNRTAERAWLSLFNMARCMLLESKLPKMLWTNAVMAAAYIRNRCYNDRLGKTPFEAMTGIKPNLSNMHVFGTACFAYIQNAKKLDPRSKEGIFVGYDKKSPAYLVYYPENNKIERVRCVKFSDFRNSNVQDYSNDDELVSVPTLLPAVEQIPAGKNIGSENIAIPELHEESNNSRYPTRARIKPAYPNEYVVETVVDKPTNDTVDYCYKVDNVPSCYEEALNSPHVTNWVNAMDDEMDSLVGNDTFVLTPIPQDREIVGSKWVYTIKTGPDDQETYKARYVAKGYFQVPAVDFHETFAPTARMSSVRILIQHAVQNNMQVHQMDVKTAYLNAPIDCDIFVEQPKGYEKQGENGEKLVCKLNKSLYGLKQSGRNWNITLHNYLMGEGFTQSLADPCVYIYFVEGDASRCIILIIWVDDLIISATNSSMLQNVKDRLSKRFKMKDLGVLHWFLGTEFICSNSEIEISQTRYIQKLLARFGMEDCKPKSTPCALGLDRIIDTDSPELDDSNLYRQIVGSLIYAMTGTRPDLCYIVTKLSQYMSKPTEIHLNAATYVLRYLKGTLDRCLKIRVSSRTNRAWTIGILAK